tara:strand:- start:532 stop:975 length:444 start_codon:yes stop_codon:yes gene_type:complete
MAIAKPMFNNKTLAILNMVNPDETIFYDWSVDEDYSIVLLNGSIELNDGTISAVTEHRIQPNENLVATCMSPERAYFITLFKISRQSLAEQIISEEAATRIQTYAPDWYDLGHPLDVKTSWEEDFVSGSYTYTRDILNTQILNSDWN